MIGLNKKNSRLFFKYFLSYIVIFLIPFVVLSSYIYHNSVTSLRDEITGSNIQKLQQVKEVTDARMKELANMAMKISFDSRLTPYKVSHPYYSKQAVEELDRYMTNSTLIDNLFLYYRGSTRAYSPEGWVSLDTLTNVYRFNHWNPAQLKKDLKTVSQPVVRPADEVTVNKVNKESVLAYLYPIPPHSSIPYGTVMFLIKESELTGLTKNILGDFKGNVYIFGKENRVLSSESHGTSIHSEEVHRLALSKPGVTSVQMNNQKYSVVTVQSKVSDWTFITVMPTAQFYQRVMHLQSIIVLVLVLFALSGFGIAIYLAIRQYRPIYNLSEYIKMRYNGSSDVPERDELTKIRKRITLMAEESEKLHKKVTTQQPFVRDQCLLKLLKGTVKNQQEVKDMLRKSQMSIEGKYFYTAIIPLDENRFEQGSLQKREKVLQLLTRVSIRETDSFGLEMIHDNTVVLLVSINGEVDNLQKSQHDFLVQLMQQLNDHFQMTPIIGAGKIYTEINQINRSYIEASAALEYKLLKGSERILFFEEISMQSETTSWYSVEEELRFIQSLKQGDHEVANDTLKKIIDSLDNKDVPIHVLRCMYFDLISTVLKTLLELGMTQYIQEVKALVEYDYLDQLEEKIHRLVSKICNEIEREKESHNTALRDNILDYISEHCRMYDLSREKVAGVFQISVSYLSRFLKEQTGTTFSQYVWHLRVEEVKRQLMATDQPVKEIVKNVGYMDVANFTRKFRKTEGMTPGQFRKMNTDQNNKMNIS
ncbi:helix-turn-helix domain-containing protein [Pseudalkalibacillus decolorationis]|uniref:helix-turn-helix domain-containing protein n=1 Tax=Pseudalkalibacillus decolorationis TaxID=163879 RepID=UPI00214725FF|nr:helix-turn-helix domain-containing protein [Pseudalkalibacillus decolorationis]